MTKTISEAVNSVVKYFRPKTEHSDDFHSSAIHYKLVFGILLAFSALSGLTSWYTPIVCTKQNKDIYDEELARMWCYAHSTYVVDRSNTSYVSGIGNTYGHPDNKVVNLSFYQWVVLALLVQAVCFQVPRILWKSFEGGRVRRMADAVKGIECKPATERTEKISLLVDYFLEGRERRRYQNYFYYFACCQSLYAFNIALQIFLTDAFLNQRFLLLVPLWLSGEPVIEYVFPLKTKCKFEFYGPSGDLQNHDMVCVLATNILNGKVYLVVWSLFLIASIAAVFQVVNLVVMYIATVSHRSLSKERDFLNSLSCTPGECLLLKFFKESVDCVTFAEFKQITLRKDLSRVSKEP